ncbi:hypothetical protein CROQUDRAFT_658171 [Cronartium quercuum f. sp. fusiforme G11]|uniref:Uncharacterized protein n=1 Tax=Cronartium quercuum f. sp. fusiforme G11 TaxID=708437 RepID=A0A9P6NLU9_9BASI|nr:hypothetical protein CROQUDRAFT_658171 [Cronartium quercuum f. sp. fusiforme G11]
MVDIEKGKADGTEPAVKALELSEKEKMKQSHFWKKTLIYVGLAAFVVLIILFSSCKFLPRVVSQHCAT